MGFKNPFLCHKVKNSRCSSKLFSKKFEQKPNENF